MRLSLPIPLSPEESITELPAAVERTPVPKPLLPDLFTSWFVSGEKHPIRVRATGERVRIGPRYSWPPFSKPLFAGRVSRKGGGSELRGKIRPTWLLMTFAAVWFIPVGGLWLLLALAYFRYAVAGGSIPNTFDVGFPQVSFMLGTGLLIAFFWLIAIRREARALRELIEEAVRSIPQS